MQEQLVYKICPLEQWHQALQSDNLPWSEVDTKDGFIHFSTRTQLFKTLDKHYKGQNGLFALEVDTSTLPAPIADKMKWEQNSPDGDTYPHLYADLPMAAVAAVYPVFATTDGGHEIPELGNN